MTVASPSGDTLRAIRAFILCLLVNSAEPGVPLRGALQPVPEGEPMPFAVGLRDARQAVRVLTMAMVLTVLPRGRHLSRS